MSREPTNTTFQADHDDCLQRLVERLARFERTRRWERIAACIILLTLTVGALVRAQGRIAEQTLQAERFELLDARGRIRGEWDVVKDSAAFSLRDANGIRRLTVEVESDGSPTIWLFDSREIGQAQIALGDGRYPFIELLDPKTSEPKLAMGIVQRGEAFLRVYDSKKRDYWKKP